MVRRLTRRYCAASSVVRFRRGFSRMMTEIAAEGTTDNFFLDTTQPYLSWCLSTEVTGLFELPGSCLLAADCHCRIPRTLSTPSSAAWTLENDPASRSGRYLPDQGCMIR